ncbi:RNB-domain-containing protein [Cenococcum geophilum 1.58]|uniref:RNB-domain-containing protein n=1 Tax=Cenococcum geophilum 1.58 TaxID=794803 RepID=UPI00358F0182|nr:RNB-domain-containing protein [Cenococcum geophilum 1.58]
MSTSLSPPINSLLERKPTIRERLQQWQEKNGTPNFDILSSFENHPRVRDVTNDLTRIGSSEASNTQSYEDDETEEYETVTDLHTTSLYLQPGDLAEIFQANREPILSVYVQSIGSQAQFYTMTGKYVHRDQQAAQFVIPSFIGRSLLDKILPYLPTKELTPELLNKSIDFDIGVPREVGAPILERLLDLWRESEKVYRDNASILDSAYATLSKVSSLYSKTLESITWKLLGPQGSEREQFIPTTAMLLAARKALLRAGFSIWSDSRNQRVTGLYSIRVKNEVEAVELVRDWMRDYQDYLAQASRDKAVKRSKILRPEQHSQGAVLVDRFAAKARELISISRGMREPTDSGGVGPSKKRFPITESSNAVRTVQSQEFTDADRLIISFLESWSLSVKFRGLPQFLSIGPMILRAVGCYEDYDHSRETGYMFLQEIGVLVPYENRIAYDEGLMLPTSRFSRQVELINTRAQLIRNDPGFHDSMADMRVNWAGQTIYCIDDEGAMEIDDGLSIARVEGKTGSQAEYWVHVHVANPTAFFNKDHALAKLAAHMTETVYTPERAYPMMPQWSSTQHFSIAPGRPVLTFSARMDSAGNIQETKIQPGTARTVVNMTPATLSRYLCLQEEEEIIMTVGGEVPKKPEARRRMRDKFHPDQIKDLNILNMLANARRQKRKEAGGVFFEMTRAEAAVYESYNRPGLGWTRPSREKARFVEGDPVIELYAKPFVNWFDERTRKNIMVQEMMLLACEIGASWCAERNIPLVYRGTARKSFNMSVQRFKKEVLEPAYDADGVLPMHVGIEYLKVFAGQTLPSTTSIPHGVLGLPHYAKVTSPLRRYGDMVTHWQIESALREEAVTGRSLVGSKESKYLAFQTPKMIKIMTTLIPRERLISKVKFNSTRFWQAQFFHRAHSFNELSLPETIKVIVTRVYNDQFWHSTISTDWSVEFNMELPETLGLPAAKVGDCWETRLVRVHLYYQYKQVVPIRLISREAEG